MFFDGINIWSVIAASVVSFILGWIWYSPIGFGKIWMKEMNITEASGKKNMAKTFSISFLFSLLTSFACAALLKSLFITSFGDILIVALVIWAGFVLAFKVHDVLFGNQSWMLFAIGAGYYLVDIVLVLAVISFFN